MLDETIAELAEFMWGVLDQYNRKRLETAVEKPDIQNIELSDEEREMFREHLMEARGSFGEMTGEEGQESLDALVAEIEATEQGWEPTEHASYSGPRRGSDVARVLPRPARGRSRP